MSNNNEIKQPIPVFTTLEPVWTYQEKLNKLENSLYNKINTVETSLSNKIMNGLDLENKRLDSFINFATSKITSLSQDILGIQEAVDKKYQALVADLNSYKLRLDRAFENKNAEMTLKLIDISSNVNSFTSRALNLGIRAEDTDEALNLEFTNLLNEKTLFKFAKVSPDEKTIIKNTNGKLSVNYGFSPTDFRLDAKNKFLVVGMHLQSGQVISADKLYNDLNNATYNIGAITSKLETVLTKLALVNHYMASNNFKKDKVDLEALDEFAIKCLSNKQVYVTRELIPVGTRIKNTHNNHIWVFNELKINNVSNFKWEDFGSDTICTADNKGTLGLVSGSNERLRGFIDINGTISINGLEEELSNILSTLKTLEEDLQHYEVTLSEHLDHIDARLDALEGR